MAAGQVHHVNVVAHAGAVRGGVVVAEHTDLLQLAYGHLSHIGQQVVRNTLGILADAAGFVGADGIEVAQQHDVPLVVARVQVGKDLLEHRFGPAVGVGGVVLRAAFGDGHELRLAVHGGARREHDVLAAVLASNFAQNQGAGDVVPVVLKRLGHRLAYGLEAGEVDNDVHGVHGENGLQGGAVQNVRLVEGERGPRRNLAYRSAGHSRDGLGLFLVGQIGKHGRHAGDFAHAPHGLATGIAQVVHDDDLVVTLEQFHHGVATDEPGTPRHQYAGFGGIFRKQGVRHGSLLSWKRRRRFCALESHDAMVSGWDGLPLYLMESAWSGRPASQGGLRSQENRPPTHAPPHPRPKKAAFNEKATSTARILYNRSRNKTRRKSPGGIAHG